MPRYGRNDENEKEIVKALLAVGASVSKIKERDGKAGVPDLLVGWKGRTSLLEIKRPTGRVSEAQDEWHKHWKGSVVCVVRSQREALELTIGEINAPYPPTPKR